MKERIYVCHTFYHVYVTILKELAKPLQQQGKATVLLSDMSINFGNLPDKLLKCKLFENVLMYHEKREESYPELGKYTSDRGNILLNTMQRIIFTRKFGKLSANDIPVNMREYKEIYIFCDKDPIGFYLNYKHIHYHAVEDGLNCLVNFDAARYDNRGAFGVKAFLSKKLNLIFIQNGYGKYCLDMEVNDIAAIKNPCPYYIELPRKTLVDRLTDEDKNLILDIFVDNKAELERKLASDSKNGKKILILTEPLCDMETRKQIFTDLVNEYSKEGEVFLKPHPRDYLDYKHEFSNVPQFDATVPMEMLNFFPNISFDLVVGVLTELSGLSFAKETVRLGAPFMDKYEAPEIHRQNEMI